MLQSALCDHPKLAEDFLEGKQLAIISANRRGMIENGQAYLIRAKGSTLGISVVVPGGAKKEQQIQIRAKARGKVADGKATATQHFVWAPDTGDDCATLIEVRGKKGLFIVGAAP
jgi:hypothetical protein